MFLNRNNRFKALDFPKDPTDYEEFEHVDPYNKLENGKWTSLWVNPHPLCHMIIRRFSSDYDGKLLWRELNAMKEQIENHKKSLYEYQKKIWPRIAELNSLIREQKKLCSEDDRASKIDTILLSAIATDDVKVIDNPQAPLVDFFHCVEEDMIMKEIISFIPLETCTQKLQRHLNECTGIDGKYKCTQKHISYDCQFKENGRCSHYYEIKDYEEELETYEYNEEEDRDKSPIYFQPNISYYTR